MRLGKGDQYSAIESNIVSNTKLTQQIKFLIEIDRLKGIIRQTLITDGSRLENSAEHSWHLAMMAIVLKDYAPGSINILRVIKMLLVHDLVEIYAGDTFCYDEAANQDKADRETAAATKLFSLLPEPQGRELQELWQEFEAVQTIESQFANALDRLQPFLQNWQTEGKTWQVHGINQQQVKQRMSPIKSGTPEIWPLVEQLIADCVEKGFLRESIAD